MRVYAALLALAAVLQAPSAGAASDRDRAVGAKQAANCPKTTTYLADRIGDYRGKPLAPQKLTELPPGTAYMAVYRHIGECEAPLTMVEYRNPRRR
jgi:hypothetical protein